MTAPTRVQLRRTRGWRKPEGAISVARPHKWGNPFAVGEHGVRTATNAAELYRIWLPDRLVRRRNDRVVRAVCLDELDHLLD